MSSETSTDSRSLGSGRSTAHSGDSALEPWQFFTLAGLLGATGVVFISQGQSPAAIILLSLTIFAAAGVGVAAWRTLAPAADPAALSAPQVVGGRTRAALEREKALALRSIKELEFDRAMGKVSEKDFGEMGARLRARALGLLRRLDAGTGYRDLIEKEIAQRTGSGSDHVDRESDALAAQPATPVQPVRSAQACTCGTPNDQDARFCKQCGKSLGVTQ